MQNVYHVQTPENVSLNLNWPVRVPGVAVAIDMLYTRCFFNHCLCYTADNDRGIPTEPDAYSGQLSIRYYRAASNLCDAIRIFLSIRGIYEGSNTREKNRGTECDDGQWGTSFGNSFPYSQFNSNRRHASGIYAVGIFQLCSLAVLYVGDLAANTVVVKKRRENALGVRSTSASEHRNPILSPREEALLREYWDRRRSLRNPLNYIPLRLNCIIIFIPRLGWFQTFPTPSPGNNILSNRWLCRNSLIFRVETQFTT